MNNPVFHRTKNNTWIVVATKGFETVSCEFDNYTQALEYVHPSTHAAVEKNIPAMALRTSSGRYLTIRYLKNGYQEVREWATEQEAAKFLSNDLLEEPF